MKSIHENSVLSNEDGKERLYELRRAKVLAALRSSPAPMTVREIMTYCGFEDPNAVRPRVTELLKDGALIEAGNVQCPITGRRVMLVAIPKMAVQAEFELASVITARVVATLQESLA